MINSTRPIVTLTLLGGLSAAIVYPQAAQAQIDIQPIVTATCEVMAGQRTPNQQELQYLLMLDDDEAFGTANPVALALYQGVLKQCPKTYLDFQERKHQNNPFPPGSLYN